MNATLVAFIPIAYNTEQVAIKLKNLEGTLNK